MRIYDICSQLRLGNLVLTALHFVPLVLCNEQSLKGGYYYRWSDETRARIYY